MEQPTYANIGDTVHDLLYRTDAGALQIYVDPQLRPVPCPLGFDEITACYVCRGRVGV